jgi:hypothetical protein
MENMLFSLHSLTSGSHVSFPSLSFFNLSPFFLQWLAAGFPASTPPGSLAALLPHSAIPSTFSAPCSPSYSPTAIAIRSRGCWSSCTASPLACHTPPPRASTATSRSSGSFSFLPPMAGSRPPSINAPGVPGSAASAFRNPLDVLRPVLTLLQPDGHSHTQSWMLVIVRRQPPCLPYPPPASTATSRSSGSHVSHAAGRSSNMARYVRHRDKLGTVAQDLPRHCHDEQLLPLAAPSSVSSPRTIF